MSVGRRNHFIPQLLLRRFASRKLGKKSWIWQVSKDGSGTETSVRNVAVSVDFYGGAKTGLEMTFGRLEEGFDQALTAIEAGENPQLHAETLTALLWTLATRTRALRNQFENLGLKVLGAMCESVRSPEARQAGIRAAKAAIDKKFDERLSKLSREQQSIAIAWLNNGGRDAMHKSAERYAESVDVVTGARRIADQIRAERLIEVSARDGQLNGLRRALEMGRLPKWLRPRWWGVCTATQGKFILGDACVMAFSRRGQLGVPMQFGHEEWHTLYLPISSSKALAAGYGVFARELSVDELNRASAKLACSYIYSSKLDTAVSNIAQLIGTADETMNAEDIRAMILDVWRTADA